MINDAAKFNIGDLVTFVVNRERKGLVTGIKFMPSTIMYTVTWDDMVDRSHYDMELDQWVEFATKKETAT